MLTQIQKIIDGLDFSSISDNRKKELEVLSQYIQSKRNANEQVQLNFICTHNSRRSQFSQLWAQVAADYYGVLTQSYSGGVEVTEFNQRAIASLIRTGFIIDSQGETNPHYSVKWKNEGAPLTMYSKLYDDDFNPNSNFAAIMTCSHADENCPIVIGCEKRISIRYEDPKAFDDTPQETEMYDRRSLEIAKEMMYVFSKVK